MKRDASAKHVVSLLVVLLLVAVSLTAARRANATLSFSAASQIQQDESDQEGVTFDNLLAAGSYSLYIEARNIGQQAHSSEITALLEPLKPMLDDTKNEYTMFADFIVANADTLSRSRVMAATQPARSSLPPLLIAVELASADAAEGFEQKFREFIMLAMKPGISDLLGSPSDIHTTESASGTPARRGMDMIIPIKRAGRLLVVSLTPFTFKGLRAQSDKSISDDPNFRAARDRFYSETLFIYYDMALSTRAMKERTESPARPAAPPKIPQPGTPLSVNNPTFSIEPESSAPLPALSQESAPASTASLFIEDSDQRFNIGSETSYQTSVQVESTPSSTPAVSPKKNAAIPAKNNAAPQSQTKPPGHKPGRVQPSAPPPLPPAPPQGAPTATSDYTRWGGSNPINGLLAGVMRGLFSNSSFPETIAIALTFEGDSLAVRLLLMNAPGTKMSPIPFMPVLVSGSAQASDAASYMPSDTDVFATASVDLNQLYEIGSAVMNAPDGYDPPRTPKDPASNTESWISTLEKRLGFKIKEDLLPTLGNEVALGIPARYLSDTPLAAVPLNSQTPQTGPVFLISVRNKEALQAKLKPVLEAVGLKAPNEKGISQKFGEIEINTYSYGSVAFVDNFLVIGDSATTVRHLLEAREKAQTLMTSRDFHSYMQWQPRETVAQVYVSAAVLKDLFKKSQATTDRYDEESKQFLARFGFDPEPITYAATSDAAGALYELRVPKNLLMRVFSELSIKQKVSRVFGNEMMVRRYLNMVNEFEKEYRKGHGRFGTLEEINEKVGEQKILRSYFESSGYKFEFTLSGDKYAATATPVEYGKTGKLSFYTDHTGVIREGDHGGKPATAADNPMVPPRNY
jgi:hypothetical protein